MKLITQKQPFLGDFSIIKSNHLASIFSNSRLLITICLLLFSSILSLSFNAFSSEITNQQVPAKKAVPVAAKSTSAKIIKGKAKGKKNKKSVVVQKDTLKDIDPATTSSPLYNN